jgi:predicted HAD superfamily Cof-like phosphohydrolase
VHKWQEMVREFMVTAQQATPDTPTVPTMEVAQLRHELIREELREFWVGTVDSLYAFKKEDLLEQAADAIGDMLYVVLGAAVAFGIDIEPVFEEIHRSNMTKFVDGQLVTSGPKAGKWIKGPSYEPANIALILKKQMD